jgi:hypothetical protein
MSTLRDRYALGLSTNGYQREVTASKKYWLYHKAGNGASYFWLGKSGAVRYSAINRIDTSIALSDAGREKLLARADAASTN